MQDACLPEHESRLLSQRFGGNRFEPVGQGIPAAFLEHAPADAVSDLHDPLPTADLDVVIDRLFPRLLRFPESRGLQVQLAEAVGLPAAEVADQEGAEEPVIARASSGRAIGQHEQVQPTEVVQALFSVGDCKQLVYHRLVDPTGHRASCEELLDVRWERVELLELDVLEQRVGAAQLLE